MQTCWTSAAVGWPTASTGVAVPFGATVPGYAGGGRIAPGGAVPTGSVALARGTAEGTITADPWGRRRPRPPGIPLGAADVDGVVDGSVPAPAGRTACGTAGG